MSFHSKVGVTILLVLLSQLALTVFSSSINQNTETTTMHAVLNNVYRMDISQKEKHILIFDNVSIRQNEDADETELVQRKGAITIGTSAVHSIDEDCPLLVTVINNKDVVHWSLPGPTGENDAVNETVTSIAERSICLDDNGTLKSLMVVLSTCSNTSITYTLSARLRRDLKIRPNQLIRTQITSSSPTVYYLSPVPMGQFDSTPEAFIIQLNSSSNACMIFSIQKPHCPFSDELDTIMTGSQWQTVTAKTALTISADDFPSGFFIVLFLLQDDAWCSQPNRGQSYDVRQYLGTQPDRNVSEGLRTKSLSLKVTTELSTKDHRAAIFLPLAFYITFIAVIFVIHLHFHRIRCGISAFVHEFPPVGPIPFSSMDIANRPRPSIDSTESMFKSRVHISGLINSQPERLIDQSKRYYMTGILVSSFYCVPVFQLILSYHSSLMSTGNFDLCYFNYMCYHKFGMFHDFNHIYSNIGYVICGIVFTVIVYLRQATVDKATIEGCNSSSIEPASFIQSTIPAKGEKPASWLPRTTWDISKGVFVHHGLFYAMGFSLAMTGVLSAAYHICPNQSNFQFDTAFMYTIAALMVVTIYQFRHPTYISANMTFLTLAIVAASTVVGLLWDSNNFRLFFTASHATFLFLILTYIHYVGYIRVNGVTVTDWRKILHVLRQKWADDVAKLRVFGFQQEVWTPKGEPWTVVLPGRCRLIFPIVVLGVNAGALVLIWTVMQKANFASQVLAVYVINCSVYSLYYSMMKFIHNECRTKLWIQPALYLGLSAFLWALSLLYFGDVVTLWERSPAESRTKNANCVFMDYYDSHDIWHFLSAAALFCSLMTLLTMDDDLLDKPKSEIPVF